MQLPAALQEGIEQELAAGDGTQLRAASAKLSRIYREANLQDGPHLPEVGKCGEAMVNAADRVAYLAVRMPATFAAISAALGWAREACPEELNEICSMLDLGSGPGTALWASAQHFPSLDHCTALERDPDLIELGRRLADRSEYPAVRNTQWLRGDLTSELPSGSWDLVVCSYAFNEVPESRRAELIRQAWARCTRLLLIVEPGTRAGFANILAVRDQMLAAHANLAAPCPHALACPMAATGDWCHFAARIERTAAHRRIKDANLGHEDEKFSYVAFMRGSGGVTEREEIPARLVRHPRIFSGYAQLTLCKEGQIEQATVTRSQRQHWRRLKRLGWGDRW